MIIPYKIKIGGHTYKIIRDYKFKERIDVNGQCDHCFLEIRLGKGDGGGEYAQSKIEEIFIHELLLNLMKDLKMHFRPKRSCLNEMAH